MPKNKHPKRKLAMKMLTRQERLDGVSPFNSVQWNFRNKNIKKRINGRQTNKSR